MVLGQTQSVSDAPSITDSTRQSVGGTGNVGINVGPDNISFGESMGESDVKAIITIDPSFSHLNGRSLRRLGVTRSTSKEKLAVVNVTCPSNMTYSSNGIKLDFSSLGGSDRFAYVYFCLVDHLSTPLYDLFVPDTNNVSSLGKLKLYDHTGTELIDGSTVIENLTFKAVIRGY